MKKKKISKGIKIFMIGYIALFIVRLIFGYLIYPELNLEGTNYQHANTTFQNVTRNYASTKKGAVNNSGIDVVNSEQKFEKVANISSSSSEFDKDVESIKSFVSNYEALIQNENSSGNSGNRSLSLAIGVNPDEFDAFVKEIEAIGKLGSIQINKTDKTNEYQDLKASQNALLQTKESLVALKAQGGSIQELISLENRILEIENQIQTLGVNLGDFDSENEFCTVNISLTEDLSVTNVENETLYRIKVAFEWATKFYFALTGMIAFSSLSVLVIVVLIEKVGELVRKLKKK